MTENVDVLVMKTAINISCKNVAIVSKVTDVFIILAALTLVKKKLFY